MFGAREFFALMRSEGSHPFAGLGIGLAAALPLLAHASRLHSVRLPYELIVIGVLALLGAALWLRGPVASGQSSGATGGMKPVASISTTLFGALYAGGTITFAYHLRYHDYTIDKAAGTVLLFFPLILTWTCDTAAFLVGREFGKRKLMPSVSPGKTIEGGLAGVLFAAIVSVIYVHLLLRPIAQLSLTVAAAVLFGIAIAVVAQIGDLAESMLKRNAGVKDSSNLIPGHGGVLDRFDSLYFVLPLSFWMLNNLLLAAPRVP